MENYDLKASVKSQLVDAINDGRLLDKPVNEIHQEVYNTDYFVIGRYEAKQWLNEYGVFEAIEKVMEYENDNFGEVNTKLHEPEHLLNMLVYILGEEFLSQISLISENWDEDLTEELQEALLTELNED